MTWDEIRHSPYSSWNSGFDLNTVKNISRARVANDSAFNVIKNNTDWLSKNADRDYSLQLDTYKKEQAEIRARYAQIDSVIRLKDPIDVSSLSTETNRWSDDKGKQERFQAWLKALGRDIYLDQAVKVVDDIINQQNLVKSGKAPATEEKQKKAF